MPYLHVLWRDNHFPARVVARDDEADLLLLELVEPLDDARLSLTPLPEAFTRMEAGQLLTALGFHDGRPFSAELRFLHSTEHGAEAEFTAQEGATGWIFEALAGAPVLMGQVTVGYVQRIPEEITSYVLENLVGGFGLRDAGAVLRLLQAPADVEETQQQSAPGPEEATQSVEAPSSSTVDAATARPPTVFISYNRTDQAWKERLATHLRVFEGQGLLNVWDDRMLPPGEDWAQQIQAGMAAANVGVVLLSAGSLTPEWVQGEVEHLLQRRDREGLHIVPVLVGPFPWQRVEWLRGLQILPRSGEPLSHLSERQAEEELAAVAREVAALLAEPPGNAAGPLDEGATRPVTPTGRPPEPSAPEPRVFRNVWYTPKEYGLFSVQNPDGGTLLVYDDRLEYQGGRGAVRISSIRGVSHTRMRGDIRANWVLVSYTQGSTPLTAYFADAQRLG
ncbi:MAG TPA: toll/interleukin-1 receptor domain-containing protein, partial [Longimicrobiaceae bacterium]|nr:toll/interleukin-1 receptor domain-containing protein [Longimicrobiaceae bacterium]